MDPLAVGINDRGGSSESVVVSREFELFLFSTDPTTVSGAPRGPRSCLRPAGQPRDDLAA